jgi:hypothetical protein
MLAAAGASEKLVVGDPQRDEQLLKILWPIAAMTPAQPLV